MSGPPALGPMTTVEVGRRRPTVLLVPLGATEQHGPHLPLHTDTVVARRWAEAVADRLPGSVVAPALPFGSSGEHQSFAGTLSVGRHALHLVLVELARSAAHWTEQVVFLSGHAGNIQPVEEAVTLLRREGHDVDHLVPRWAPDSDGSIVIDAHAGRTETSLMLHLEPDAVHRPRPGPGETRPLSEIIDRLVADGVEAVSPSGILGDPGPAAGNEGRLLFDRLVTATVERLSGRSSE